jgi:putative SOS response-associated peptidase YedK
LVRNTPPRYNIAPTQDVLFVTAVDKLRESRWWLVAWPGAGFRIKEQA